MTGYTSGTGTAYPPDAPESSIPSRRTWVQHILPTHPSSACPPDAPEFSIPFRRIWVNPCFLRFVFCSLLCRFCSCRPLFLFVHFLVVIVLSFPRYMASDCPFSVFKLFSILLDKLSVISVNLWGNLSIVYHSSSCNNFYYLPRFLISWYWEPPFYCHLLIIQSIQPYLDKNSDL